MKAQTALNTIRHALKTPISIWDDFYIGKIPLVIFDDEDFFFLNHPRPPLERPKRLFGAGTMPINNVMTAMIPCSLFPDEEPLPMFYHECFHVYQVQKHFNLNFQFNFLQVFAFYPEMNPAYRTLCTAESEVLNDSLLTPLEQARYLAALTVKRQAILLRQEGLLEMGRHMERNEGTAQFVEEKAREILFGKAPGNLACHYSYSRQYPLGAAICRLLKKIAPAQEWQADIQQGTSLTDLLIRYEGD